MNSSPDKQYLFENMKIKMFKILDLSTESVKEGLFLEFTKSVQLTFYSEVSSYFTGEAQKVLFLPSTN